jgi:hypothetical protein
MQAESGSPIQFRLIVSVLGVIYAAMVTHRRNFAKYLNKIGDPGRPAELPCDLMSSLAQTIMISYQKGRPLFSSEIQFIRWTPWHVQIPQDTRLGAQ